MKSIFYLLIIVFSICFVGCKSNKATIKYDYESDIQSETNYNDMQQNISVLRESIIKEAMSWIGTPYKYGSAEKGRGTDCSGMVMSVIKTVTNIKMPRNSALQGEWCKNINMDDALPGDLVFYATSKNKNKISHVGIIIDNENFIHASTSKGVVVSQLSANYYKKRFIMCGRIPNLD